MSNNPRNLRLSLFGAAPDTPNLGVSALFFAILLSLKRQQPKVDLTVFDFGRGIRPGSFFFSGKEIHFASQGAFLSRRYYLPENFRTMRLLSMFGGLGNKGLATIRNSDAVLDISAGDSFSDIYGRYRFQSVIFPKLIALRQKTPLILLPQTYGPFKSEKNKDIASHIVRNALMAWSRDVRSYEVLKELLGDDYDPGRHKSGVDVAFGLPAVKPVDLPEGLETSIANSDVDIVGINISGLIYNNSSSARLRFGLHANYNHAVESLIRRFLHETDVVIALTPHVGAGEGSSESDLDANRDIVSKLGPIPDNRLFVLPSYSNPCEIKWVISKYSWLCGTRMHSTIAALSSGVPVSAISYSAKTLGVFETCGQGAHVADPRKLTTDELLEKVWDSWTRRHNAKEQLNLYMPQVVTQVEEQIKTILDVIPD